MNILFFNSINNLKILIIYLKLNLKLFKIDIVFFLKNF